MKFLFLPNTIIMHINRFRIVRAFIWYISWCTNSIFWSEFNGSKFLLKYRTSCHTVLVIKYSKIYHFYKNLRWKSIYGKKSFQRCNPHVSSFICLDTISLQKCVGQWQLFYAKKQMFQRLYIVKFNIFIKILEGKTSTEKNLSSGTIPMFLALFV